MKKATTLVTALCSGILFGLGLIVSQMADPARVKAFFDLSHWDPTLAAVMAGALCVTLPGFHWLRRHPEVRAWDGKPMQEPTATRIDAFLLIGAVLFGTGWVITGLCPGPAVVQFFAGSPWAILNMVFLLAGLWLGHTIKARVRQKSSHVEVVSESSV